MKAGFTECSTMLDSPSRRCMEHAIPVCLFPLMPCIQYIPLRSGRSLIHSHEMPMTQRNYLLPLLLTISLFVTPSLFAQQDDEKNTSDPSSKWELEKSYEELKTLTEKEHNPELERKQLTIFRKPGVYKGTGTTTITKLDSNGQKPQQKKDQITQRSKYVDGKYIVVRMSSDKRTQWIIVTYDETCSCYRSWVLHDERIFYTALGKQVKNSNVISWSGSFPVANEKHIVNTYEIISEDRRSMQQTSTAIFPGKQIIRFHIKYTFQKPLENETDANDENEKNKNEQENTEEKSY